MSSALKKLGTTPFFSCRFDEINSLNPVPPTAASGVSSANVFSAQNRKAILRVSEESIAAYKESEVWSGFAKILALNVEATSITLNKTSETIKEEETLQLIATVAPADATDKSVSWSSSDETVATVNENGLVTALKAGTATITAQTSNGLKATCALKVDEKTGINGVDGDGISVTVRDGVIIVVAPDGMEVEVYSLAGLRAAKTREHRIDGLAKGAYIVRVGAKTVKVIL